jgi:hypothetical protein
MAMETPENKAFYEPKRTMTINSTADPLSAIFSLQTLQNPI